MSTVGRSVGDTSPIRAYNPTSQVNPTTGAPSGSAATSDGSQPATGANGTSAASTTNPVPTREYGATYSLTGQPVASIAAGVTVPFASSVAGATYIWDAQFAGTGPYSVQLLALGSDGVTQRVVSTVTAVGAVGVVLGQNATVYLKNNGANAITGVSSSLS